MRRFKEVSPFPRIVSDPPSPPAPLTLQRSPRICVLFLLHSQIEGTQGLGAACAESCVFVMIGQVLRNRRPQQVFRVAARGQPVKRGSDSASLPDSRSPSYEYHLSVACRLKTSARRFSNSTKWSLEAEAEKCLHGEPIHLMKLMPPYALLIWS